MRDKPRLLFLAYAFPPIDRIGSVRAYNIAKWLTRKGWETTVVTPFETAGGRAAGAMDVHEDLSRQGIRCMRTAHRWQSLLPAMADRRRGLAWAAGGVSRRISAFLGIEREAGWIIEAAKACEALAPADVDAVLASGPPFASFGLARRIAANLGRPYVLDYRDLWTRNPYARRSRGKRAIETERSILANCAAVTGVSPSLRESLREQFGTGKSLHVISNGFDPDEMASVPQHDFGHFAIVYTGTFYPPKSAVDPLMAALKLVDRRDGQQRNWRFHYYGYQGDYVRGMATKFGIAHRVVVHGRVPRRGALAALRGANVAVVISSVYEESSLEDRGIVTGKVFDAIGLGTPLLVIAPAGSDLEGVLRLTRLGKRFVGTEIEGMAGFLRDAMNGGAPVDFSREPFSWNNIVEELDGILRAAARGNG